MKHGSHCWCGGTVSGLCESDFQYSAPTKSFRCASALRDPNLKAICLRVFFFLLSPFFQWASGTFLCNEHGTLWHLWMYFPLCWDTNLTFQGASREDFCCCIAPWQLLETDSFERCHKAQPRFNILNCYEKQVFLTCCCGIWQTFNV